MEPDAATVKAELAARKERDEAVRTFERMKAKAGNTAVAADSMMEDAAAANTSLNVSQSAEDLNNLWQRIRSFLNGRDDEGNLVEHSQPGRVRFTKICEDRQRMQRNSAPGILPFAAVTEAFVSSRLHPRPTDEDFKALFTALEAYHNEGLGLINWRSILSAPVERDAASYRGIFPRIVSSKPSMANYKPSSFNCFDL